MFDLRKIPMVRILAPFLGGLMAGLDPDTTFEPIQVLIMLSMLYLLACLLFRCGRRARTKCPWMLTAVLFFLIFLSGTGTGIVSRPQDPGLPTDQWLMVRGELCTPSQQGPYGYVFELKTRLIYSVHGSICTETVLRCYLSDSLDSLLPDVGENWQFAGRLSTIENSGNPGMPDYKAILGRKNCWYRLIISSSKLVSNYNCRLVTMEDRLSPERIRQMASAHWQGDQKALSLLKAVCLGDRSLLTEELRMAYSQAGGMHLLAVSGLHVGLIWWVLQLCTAWMVRLFRNGLAQVLLVLGLLWFYAYVTGFSSSVCRSVTMFSFFSLSRIRGEGISTLNVIFASAFLLAIIDPMRIMDVGFQLSYLAIAGIVCIFPLSSRLLRPRWPLLRWLWQASSVSLAAQLATAPLVIYYFHQFPVYSLITSIIALPLLSILMALFVTSIPLLAAGILEKLSSFLLVSLARLLNGTMEYLGALPGAVLRDLYLEPSVLAVWAILLTLLVLALHGQGRLPVYLALLCLSFSLVWTSLKAVERRSGSELLIANFRRASHLSFRSGRYVDHYCWCNDSTSLAYMDAFRKSRWGSRYYRQALFEEGDMGRVRGEVSSCMRIGKGCWYLKTTGLRALVLRGPDCKSLPTWEGKQESPGIPFRPDLILLSGEPALELLEGLPVLEEIPMVIDGSNRSWYKKKLLAIREHIYLTDLEGAYVKRW
jgi:competence protein ComEC